MPFAAIHNLSYKPYVQLFRYSYSLTKRLIQCKHYFILLYCTLSVKFNGSFTLATGQVH